MRSHLLSVAAIALLSVFVVVSTPCLAASDEAGGQSSSGVDPAALPPNSDPSQTVAPPADGADAEATIEEPVADEEVPPSEE
ncbi:MAG: hypothetical protein ACAH80_17755 [Alphaproteobacteria bacterium]